MPQTNTENKPTYWFYKWKLWIRIALLICMWPVFIPIAFWPKIQIHKKSKYLVLGLWIICSLTYFSIIGSASKTQLPSQAEPKNTVTINKSIEQSKLTPEQEEQKAKLDAESTLKKVQEEQKLKGENEAKAKKQVEEEKAKTQAEAEQKKREEAEKKIPVEYKSALNKASSYANKMNMSKQGVFDQLTSEYGEKFSKEAAQYAIDNVQANWNANALAKARTYQSRISMSTSSVHDQLVSNYGEKFTQSEADYALQELSK